MNTSEPRYGTVLAKDVMMPMRDGVQLAADIYHPAINGEVAPGQFPVILGRTSYDKTWPQLWVEPVANFFAPRGYVVVIQDLRGRHGSEGTGQYHHTANPREGEDGYDTVEWIAEQPWSNSRVGMVGSSHGGIVQTVASLTKPPHLACMWVDVAPTNIFAHEAREGGAMALHMFGALFLHAFDAQEIRDDPVAQRVITDGLENFRELVLSMPFKPGHTPLRVVPNLEETLFDYYYRGEYDEFWSQECCDQTPHFDRAADIPAVFSGGWYDPFAVATTGQFSEMTTRNKSPQRLLIGPWTHSGMRSGATFAGDVDFGPDAWFGSAVYNEHRLRWFDHWLKDQTDDIEDEPPVRMFVMGGGTGRRNNAGRLDHGGTWRFEQEWPLARTSPTTYYLGSRGDLTTEVPTRYHQSISYTHDPETPVPTIGGNMVGLIEMVELPEWADPSYVTPRARMRQIVQDGGAHQSVTADTFAAKPPYLPLAMRPDVLVFQTDVLKQDIELTGPCEVALWVASTAVDTDFTAKLVDVYPASEDYPGGYHLNLCDSIIRARYRNGYERGEMMKPGEVYQVRIALPPISNLFKVGHRIRLDIASSNFPRFDVNPNTGEPVGKHTHTVWALNTVYVDNTRPSQIVLPVIPR